MSIAAFARRIMADEALAADLAAIREPGAFIAQAVADARSHGIEMTEESLHAALRPDPLGLARWCAPALAGCSLPPRHWLPASVGTNAGATYVDWAWFGPQPLRAPLYEDDLRRALHLPFNRVLRYRTGLGDLLAQAATMRSLAPDGFIFHMSRCGSTLVAQMLAALPDSIVISESAPIDAVVQLANGLSAEDGPRALRAIVSAFGRRRCGRERRFFVKLDCWHTLALPLFRRAFPQVPWIFLYRDPVEILVSQMRLRGMQMLPQFFPPRFYGIAEADGTMDEDYCARVLAAICRAVLDHRGLGGELILNYRDLPEAVFAAILPHFGVSCDADAREAMGQVARQDAKTPSLPFAADAASKQHAATEKIRRAAEQHLFSLYDRLEALRGVRSQANAPDTN